MAENAESVDGGAEQQLGGLQSLLRVLEPGLATNLVQRIARGSGHGEDDEVIDAMGELFLAAGRDCRGRGKWTREQFENCMMCVQHLIPSLGDAPSWASPPQGRWVGLVLKSGRGIYAEARLALSIAIERATAEAAEPASDSADSPRRPEGEGSASWEEAELASALVKCGMGQVFVSKFPTATGLRTVDECAEVDLESLILCIMELGIIRGRAALFANRLQRGAARRPSGSRPESATEQQSDGESEGKDGESRSESGPESDGPSGAGADDREHSQGVWPSEAVGVDLSSLPPPGARPGGEQGAFAEEDDAEIEAVGAQDRDAYSEPPTSPGGRAQGGAGAGDPSDVMGRGKLTKQLRQLLRYVRKAGRSASGQSIAKFMALGHLGKGAFIRRAASLFMLETEEHEGYGSASDEMPQPGQYATPELRAALSYGVGRLQARDFQEVINLAQHHAYGDAKELKVQTAFELGSGSELTITTSEIPVGEPKAALGYLDAVNIKPSAKTNTWEIEDISAFFGRHLLKQLRAVDHSMRRSFRSRDFPDIVDGASEILALIFDGLSIWLNSNSCRIAAVDLKIENRRDYIEQMLLARFCLSVESIVAPDQFGAGILPMPILRGSKADEQYIMRRLDRQLRGSAPFQARCDERDVFQQAASGARTGGAAQGGGASRKSAGKSAGGKSARSSSAVDRSAPVKTTAEPHRDAAARKTKADAIVNDVGAIKSLNLRPAEVQMIAAIGLPNHDFAAERLWRPSRGYSDSDTSSLRPQWVRQALKDWKAACASGSVDAVTARDIGERPPGL